MELIPDLPKDLARECLSRVSYQQLPVMASVCKSWRQEVSLPEFSRHRKTNGRAQKLVVMAQARVDSDRRPGSAKKFSCPVYRLTVLEPSTGVWVELPPIPQLPDGMPVFCHLAAVGSELVVLGGLHPVTWEVSDSVYVFDFVSCHWRCGAPMPAPRRSFFGCASDSSRLVYVAGGHDADKNALRSAMAYDVAADTWVTLPDMAEERDECKAVFQSGTLLVVGGYASERQGQFGRSAEAFDLEAWRWGPVSEDFLYDFACPRTCTAGGGDGELYACRGEDVVVRRGGRWEEVGRLPVEVANVAHVERWEGQLLVVGAEKFGDPHVWCLLDARSSVASRSDNREEFSGHVQAGCFMEI